MDNSPPENGANEPPLRGERIAKLLARAGVASRREVERMIAEGRVRIGEEVVTTPATLLTTFHGLTVDGKAVQAPEAARLFVFHKPTGLLTAERDPRGRPTIYAALANALPKGTPRLMPVGRLDLNTEGLLLLTNDGELKRAMELPASGIPRTYRARTYGEVSQQQLEALMDGTTIDGVHYGRIDANMERRTGRNQWIELTLTEGKNREVRRVLEALGLEVSRLLRLRYGPFELGDLPRGQAYEVRPADVERFMRTLKDLPRPAAKPKADAPAAGGDAGRPARRGPGRSGPPRRKPDPSRPVDRDAPRSPPRSDGRGSSRSSEGRDSRGERSRGPAGRDQTERRPSGRDHADRRPGKPGARPSGGGRGGQRPSGGGGGNPRSGGGGDRPKGPRR
ncbi:MAG: pseudouridine synthase [Novosphingobium sp.]